MTGPVLIYSVCDSTGKEREKAGSLAALGMTTRKTKAKAEAKVPNHSAEVPASLWQTVN